MTAIGQTLAINATALLAVILLLWAYSVKIRDVSFIDAFWAFGMVLLAWASWTQSDAPGALSHVLLGLTTLWGLRLSLHLWTRWPILPGALAAASSLPAGIGLPALAPSALRSAPGFLIASAMKFFFPRILTIPRFTGQPEPRLRILGGLRKHLHLPGRSRTVTIPALPTFRLRSL